MKKESFKTLIWICIGVVWTGAYKMAAYLAEMQYSSKVAPSQLDDDNAYAVMKTHGAVISLIDYIYFAGFLVIACFIVMIWIRRIKPGLPAAR